MAYLWRADANFLAPRILIIFALFLAHFIDLSVFLFSLYTKTMPETRNSKTSVGSPSADKSLSTEIAIVTTAMLNEMLQPQERMFKTLVDSLVSNFNSRLDTVVGTVAELKTRLNICQKDTKEFTQSLEFSQKDIDELKPCKTKLAEIEDNIEDIHDCVSETEI